MDLENIYSNFIITNSTFVNLLNIRNTNELLKKYNKSYQMIKLEISLDSPYNVKSSGYVLIETSTYSTSDIFNNISQLIRVK